MRPGLMGAASFSIFSRIVLPELGSKTLTPAVPLSAPKVGQSPLSL